MLKIRKIILSVVALLLVAACASTQSKDGSVWKCSAPGIASDSQYYGGDKAFIHLNAYSSGMWYPAVRSGYTATGKTSDGTMFTCTGKPGPVQ